MKNIFIFGNKLGSYRVVKQFSTIDDKLSFITRKNVLERFPLELMKMMEMYEYNDGIDVPHWAEKPLVPICDALGLYTPQELLATIIQRTFDETIAVYGVNGSKLLKKKFGTPDKFVDAVRNRMLTESHRPGEDPKYVAWFKTHPPKVSNEDFVRFVKTLALCLSEQLSADSIKDEYWEPQTAAIVRTTKVNYKVNPYRKLSKGAT